jgi:hypothetical protein
MGASTAYYQNNEGARNKKKAYDKKLNSRKEQIQKRVESNAKVRKAKKNGQNIAGKDYDHATNSFVLVATNRGRKGEGGRKTKKS